MYLEHEFGDDIKSKNLEKKDEAYIMFEQTDDFIADWFIKFAYESDASENSIRIIYRVLLSEVNDKEKFRKKVVKDLGDKILALIFEGSDEKKD